MNHFRSAAVALGLSTLSAAFFSTSANAIAFSLNFEGINPTYNNSTGSANILEFYNGGNSSAGTSGVNYGVSFGSNALAVCLNSLTVTCSNGSRGGLAPSSATGALYFLTGSQTYMNVAAGFDTGFSFNYSSISTSGAVNVYSGANGTGTLLATLNLVPNAGSCPGYNAAYCPFGAAGVSFAGIAHSISFAGVANFIAFDDVTLGSAIPAPEPATVAMWAAGLIGLCAYGRSRPGGSTGPGTAA